DRRPHERAGEAREGGYRLLQGPEIRSLGESHLPQGRSELQSDHGNGGRSYCGAGEGIRGARPARSRDDRHARHFRRSRGRGRWRQMSMPPSSLTRRQIAWRAAQDIADGSYVNLGIGLPTLVADFIPADREIVFHSENGILGLGRAPAPGEVDPDLINAGKGAASLLPGGAFFHHNDAFLMIRGGHIDVALMGAFEVSEEGDL